MISFGAINNLRKSATVKTIGIYTFTNFFTKGISFLLIPLFTNPKYLTPEDNGMLSLFNNASLFLMPFISLGLIQSTSTDFFKLNKKEFKDFFTTGFFLAIIMTIISIIVMLLLKDVLQNKFGLPNNLIWVIPLITFLTFCSEQIVRIIRNNNQPGIFMGIGIVKIIAELGIAVILIVGFAFGWYGRITGLIIALCLVTAYAVYYFLKKDYLVGAVKKKYIKSELLYALPIMLMQGSIFVMTSSDRFFLADDHVVLGIYSVACIFVSIIIVFSNALLQYFLPTIFNLLSADSINYARIRQLFYYYGVAMLGVTIIVVVFTSFMYKLFINERYHHALAYINLLAAGNFFWTMTSLFYSFLLFYKKKRQILLFSGMCIVISLACNYYFIQRYNDTGAAIATLFCYLVVFVLSVLFTKQYLQKVFIKNK